MASISRFLAKHGLHRGEGQVASIGLLIAVGVVVLTACAAWWSAQAQRDLVRDARADHVRSVADVLASSSQSLLADGDVSALRRLISETAIRNDLRLCELVLADGEVIASHSPGSITVVAMPASLPVAASTPRAADRMEDDLELSLPLQVRGEWVGSLNIVASVDARLWDQLRSQHAVGIMLAVTMVGLLLFYRHTRDRFAAAGLICEALRNLGDREPATEAITLHPDFGPEARTWNRLISDNAELHELVTGKRALQGGDSAAAASGDLSRAVDAISHGIIVFDSQQCVRYCNGAAAVLLGKTREQCAGAQAADLLPEGDVRDALHEAASGRVRAARTFEIDQREHDADSVLRMTVRPIRGDGGVSAVVVIDDITQHRVAEAARQAFVNQATHELRTPLTNIRLYTEMMIDGGDDASVRAKALNVINGETARLERIVSEMLSVAEIEAGSMTITRDDVRVDELLRNLEGEYAPQAQDKKLEFVLDLPPKMPTVKGDRDKINLALHNLVGNALKYTPAGGRVSVECRPTEAALVIDVLDTGIGISDEDAARIFEKFYRAKDDRVAEITGTGLGLALARELVQLHGGDITLDSTLNVGSTFTLTLPLNEEAEA